MEPIAPEQHNQGKRDVVFYTNLFPTPNDPGRGIFVQQLVMALKDKVNVKVVCPLPWFPHLSILKRFPDWYKMSEVPEQAEIMGVEVHYPKYLLLPKISEYIHGFLMLLGSYFTTRRLLRECDQPLLSSHWVYPDGLSALLISKLEKVSVTVTARGCDINRDSKNKILRRMISYTLKEADSVVTVSESLGREAVGLGADESRVHVIPNGVDRERFHILGKSECRSMLNYNVAEHAKVIVFIGQLVPVKDHETFIRAFSRVVATADDLDIHAYFVGEGYLEEVLTEMVATMGMSDRIHFVGNQPHDSIPMWIGSSDLTCLTSIREGRPNAVIESLACGRPVVGSHVGGIPELINDENGFTFAAGNDEQLAEMINKALHRSWDAESVSATIDHLCWERAATNYVDLFNSISEQKTT